MCEADVTCSALKVDDTADADALLEKAAAALEAAGHGEKTAARERRLDDGSCVYTYADGSYSYSGHDGSVKIRRDAEKKEYEREKAEFMEGVRKEAERLAREQIEAERVQKEKDMAEGIKLLHTECDFSDPSVSFAEALAACEALLKHKECGDETSSSPSPQP